MIQEHKFINRSYHSIFVSYHHLPRLVVFTFLLYLHSMDGNNKAAESNSNECAFEIYENPPILLITVVSGIGISTKFTEFSIRTKPLTSL